MNHDHYAQYILRQLSSIQYDNGSATTRAHYQLGPLMDIIAQQADQNNKIWDLVRAELNRIICRKEAEPNRFQSTARRRCQPIFGGPVVFSFRSPNRFRTVRPASTSIPSLAVRTHVFGLPVFLLCS
jgi:hypothetical protein